MSLGILDYGMGNILSVSRKMKALNQEVQIVNTPSKLLSVEKLIIPGVGHFGKAMSNLHELGLSEVLNEMILVRKTPVLGICLGMQLFGSYSEEGNVEGLNWIPGSVRKLDLSDNLRYKVPHTGWNSLKVLKSNPLLAQVTKDDLFYFVHAYYFKADHAEMVSSTTEYETSFASAIRSDNIYGVQFHPEKSHETGLRMLKKFIEL